MKKFEWLSKQFTVIAYAHAHTHREDEYAEQQKGHFATESRLPVSNKKDMESHLKQGCQEIKENSNKMILKKNQRNHETTHS